MNRWIPLVAGSILFCGLAPAAGQSTWAERLGYPAGQRIVIFHADDMGAAYEFHQAGQSGLESGRLQSVAVLVPGPWSPEFARWRQEHGPYDVGLSLSFVAPSPVLRWGPVTSHDQVSSLVTPNGYFPPTVAEFVVRADPDEVRREAERQIELARAQGLQPTHLLPHMGSLFEKPELLAIYFELAEKYWIPAVMVEMTPALGARFARQGRPVPDALARLIEQYPLPKIDNVTAVDDADSYQAKRARFYQVIEELPPGITQVFLTPAKASPALKQMTRRWQNRVWESRLLEDPEVERFLNEQDLVYTDWVEIMRRFEDRLQAGNRRASAATPSE